MQSQLHQWFDRDFHEMGAFLTTSDNEFVYFAKGGVTETVSEFHKTNRTVFYLKDFYTNSYEAYIPGEVLKISRAEVQDFIKCWDFNPVSYPALKNEEETYKKDFAELKEAFKGDIKKVVLISRESYDGSLSLLKLMKKAFDFGTGIPYGFWNEDYGILGSTPELLYDVNDSTLTTFALAGTARLGEEEELLNSSKDRNEHNLVIRDIEEKLSGFSSQIETEETGIHKYKNIIHLRTNIKAQVHPELNYTDLTNLFSPTAALGGYPKNQSMEFLAKSQYAKKYPKRYFGSAFGLMSPETKQFVVAIRNVQWKDHQLFIECGGGVVPESVLEKEIEEIHLKRNTIRKHYL